MYSERQKECFSRQRKCVAVIKKNYKVSFRREAIEDIMQQSPQSCYALMRFLTRYMCKTIKNGRAKFGGKEDAEM
jgi:hypothetical protein